MKQPSKETAQLLLNFIKKTSLDRSIADKQDQKIS
jgi:hypothetical protein